MLALKGCRKCGGDLVTEPDHEVGTTLRCLQCGLLRFLAHGHARNGGQPQPEQNGAAPSPAQKLPNDDAAHELPFKCFRDVQVRAMIGPNILGYWTAVVGWDPNIKAWADADLWSLVQEVFDLWPWAEVRRRCRCNRKLEVRRGKLSSGARGFLLGCQRCEFAVLLAEAEGPFSGPNVQVVSVRLYGVEAALGG